MNTLLHDEAGTRAGKLVPELSPVADLPSFITIYLRKDGFTLKQNYSLEFFEKSDEDVKRLIRADFQLALNNANRKT